MEVSCAQLGCLLALIQHCFVMAIHIVMMVVMKIHVVGIAVHKKPGMKKFSDCVPKTSDFCLFTLGP